MLSRIGLVRPLARYARPIPRMKLRGECETLLRARGSSFPLGDAAGAKTFTSGRAAWRTSQQRASSASYAAGATLRSPTNCGLQFADLFGSFQITTSAIEG